MGTELIIPGTPLADIPPYDRPNFDPRQQNGYLAGSLTSPPPGSSVEHYVLQGVGGTVPLVPTVDHSVSAVATATKAVFTSFLTLLGAVFSDTARGRYRIVLQDLTAVTTTDVFVCLHSAAPTDDIDLSLLTKLAGALVVEGDLVVGGIYNADTVDHQIGIACFVVSDSAQFGYYPLQIAMPTGVLLNPVDVLRVRYATAGFALTASDAPIQMPDEADLEYYLGTPSVSIDDAPALRLAMRGAKLDGWQTFYKINAGVTPKRLYSLEQTRDILGTDFNPAGSPYAPVFQVGVWIKSFPDQALPTIGPSYSLQVDIYRGANQ